jgi:hypothetical protein
MQPPPPPTHPPTHCCAAGVSTGGRTVVTSPTASFQQYVDAVVHRAQSPACPLIPPPARGGAGGGEAMAPPSLPPPCVSSVLAGLAKGDYVALQCGPPIGDAAAPPRVWWGCRRATAAHASAVLAAAAGVRGADDPSTPRLMCDLGAGAVLVGCPEVSRDVSVVTRAGRTARSL